MLRLPPMSPRTSALFSYTTLFRSQVVPLGADVRRLPHAGAGGWGPLLLLRAALPAGRHRQRAVPAAAEGEARQPRQRLIGGRAAGRAWLADRRSEEHTSELQSLMRISYAVFCLEEKKDKRDL